MFRLLRYFSITSFVAFVLVTVVLAVFYRQTALNDLITLRQNNNVTLTQVFANTLWPQFKPFVDSATGRDGDDLRADPETERLHLAVLEQTEGLSVIKVKVYNLDGLTVFSSEAAQIGDDKSSNQGFLMARDGEVASELTHRDTFSAFEAVIEDRDVVSSYVPIRSEGATGEIEGVFEVYDDVTPLLDRIERTQLRVVLVVVALLSVLYAGLFWIVRRADRIMSKQRAEIQSQNAALVKANHDLVIAHNEAEMATRLKSEFLSTMSHELRTPLNTIMGYSGILIEGISGEIDVTASRMVKSIYDSSEHLLALINNILDLSKIEAGRMELVEDDLSISALVKQMQSQMSVLAQQKHLSFDVDIAPEMPHTLRGDKDRIAQIIINLLSNAFKFTDKGGVGLYLYWQNQSLVIRVRDTGIGIPPHALNYVFDEFRQVDGTTTRPYEGTGLGLAIVRKLTTAMKGSVKVESVVGSGSVFTVTLPLKPVATNQPEPVL